MFTALFQIAKNTFRESLREPIFLLVLLSALSMIGLFPLFTMFVFRAQDKLVIDSGMATTMIFGWVISVLIASYAISREIDNGTALLLLSKPVQRPVFIIAKILGILSAVTVFWFLCALATLVSLRIASDQFRIDFTIMALYFGAIILGFVIAGIHNYVTRSSFPMTTVLSLLVLFPLLAIFAHFKPYNEEQPGLALYVIPALILILYSVWAMASLATALSTRLNLVSNLLVCSVLFMVGLMSDYLLGRQAREPWLDSAPKGKETLWLTSYRFAPTEMADVDKWQRPEIVDAGEAFVVWSDQERPAVLPTLGKTPDGLWKDGQGWKNELNDLDGRAQHMARYDVDSQSWQLMRIAQERQSVPPGATGLDAAYDAYAFRRSNNHPRVPVGGNYANPLPDGGSYLATALYACIPNWQLFWMADALAAQKKIPAAYVVYGAAYVVVMNALLMLLAVALFWEREVGKQIIT